ncbi:hypothetical protein BLL42_02175 [Pseudomonas frederiksbergensis]|uniref:Uncharacterized protein n=1 Tax=Pseudomonas frederiksbergensis TaxID=104087 RepID=A0A1J0EER4_9PSED|nr:hypothetical protein BLL42_02175 [Pseudomonas frederiksbergensis]
MTGLPGLYFPAEIDPDGDAPRNRRPDGLGHRGHAPWLGAFGRPAAERLGMTVVDAHDLVSMEIAE